MIKLLRRRGLRAVRIAGASASQAGAIPVQASRRAASALMALTLTACQTPAEPQIRTVTVKVPVPVNCTSNIPKPAQHVDSDEALRLAKSIHERVALLLAGRFTRMAEVGELRASVSGCE